MSIWLKRRLAWMFFAFSIMGGPIILFLAFRIPAQRAVAEGFLIGWIALVTMVAGAEIITPALFMRWRSWMMEGSPDRALGDAFDGLLGTPGPEPWTRREARTRTRIFGMVLLGAALLTAWFVWWVFSSAGFL